MVQRVCPRASLHTASEVRFGHRFCDCWCSLVITCYGVDIPLEDDLAGDKVSVSPVIMDSRVTGVENVQLNNNQ